MLQIAKILKSNGVDGDLLVSAPQIDLEQFQGPVFINFDGLPVPFFIEKCSPVGTTRYVIHITDVESLSDADELVGLQVLAPEDAIQTEESDEPDFTGWIVSDKGSRIGVVVDCEPIPGNFCLYVRLDSDGQEAMIPLHPDFVEQADPQRQILHLRLPDGLY